MLTAETVLQRQGGEQPGDYEIGVSGGKAANYKFEYVFGTFTIVPSVLIVSGILMGRSISDPIPYRTQ